MRVLALIPPCILFVYAPFLDAPFLDSERSGSKNGLQHNVLEKFELAEFDEPPFNIKKLCKVIIADNYNVSTEGSGELKWLNALLKVPNFYDIIYAKKSHINFSKRITTLVDKTKDYRNKNFIDLKEHEQYTIRRLNRFLLEETYPQETPKIQENMLTRVFCLPLRLFYIWFPSDTDNENVFSRVFGNPGLLFLLSSVAIWPLLIFGLYQYHKISDALYNEIRKYRLPLRVALFVKFRYVIKAISPAFYIAIALVFVVCVEAESPGNKTNQIDGVAGFYMNCANQFQHRDGLVFGVCVLTFLGLVFLGVWDLIALYFCRLRHIQFEGIKKRNRRRL